MIEYKGHLNVSKHDFYTLLLEQLCADVNQRTGSNITVKAIQNGYRYKVKKKRGNYTIEAISEIKKPVLDKIVESVYEIAGKKYIMSYEINEIDDNNIEVTYKQDNGVAKENPLNKLSIIYTARKRLKQFEKYIKANK